MKNKLILTVLLATMLTACGGGTKPTTEVSETTVTETEVVTTVETTFTVEPEESVAEAEETAVTTEELVIETEEIVTETEEPITEVEESVTEAEETTVEVEETVAETYPWITDFSGLEALRNTPLEFKDNVSIPDDVMVRLKEAYSCFRDENFGSPETLSYAGYVDVEGTYYPLVIITFPDGNFHICVYDMYANYMFTEDDIYFSSISNTDYIPMQYSFNTQDSLEDVIKNGRCSDIKAYNRAFSDTGAGYNYLYPITDDEEMHKNWLYGTDEVRKEIAANKDIQFGMGMEYVEGIVEGNDVELDYTCYIYEIKNPIQFS